MKVLLRSKETFFFHFFVLIFFFLAFLWTLLRNSNRWTPQEEYGNSNETQKINKNSLIIWKFCSSLLVYLDSFLFYILMVKFDKNKYQGHFWYFKTKYLLFNKRANKIQMVLMIVVLFLYTTHRQFNLFRFFRGTRNFGILL